MITYMKFSLGSLSSIIVIYEKANINYTLTVPISKKEKREKIAISIGFLCKHNNLGRQNARKY